MEQAGAGAPPLLNLGEQTCEDLLMRLLRFRNRPTGREHYADTLRKQTNFVMHSRDLSVSNLAMQLTEGLLLKSTNNVPKLASKKAKQAEGQKQVVCWIYVKARQPGVTL